MKRGSNDNNNNSGFTHCSKCGARIMFLRMTSGKKMPVDTNFVNYTAGGKDRIVLTNGKVVAGTVVNDPQKADGFGYISHFATCKYANNFRK